ncbi:hypothetical protein JOL79_06805 [Microbispora sp. RL4-1S]|uniref:Uncharacterized protein n=1 Tax=Microbispora oryzae TaxID=2806554 RepID=A0A940WHW3_9ACTN|nr:hypothetical protein [Microbispora oryzae]MBP2703507.1 hypothetical protein [Microbispora oryzae]
MHSRLRFALTAAAAAALAAVLVWAVYQAALALLTSYVQIVLGVMLVAVLGAAADPGGGGPYCT